MSQTKQQTFYRVLIKSSCPEALATSASEIAAKYYPNGLIGATEAETNTFKQAQKYLRD